MTSNSSCYRCFFFNDTATTEIYTLSLHDALPILKADDDAGGRRRFNNAALCGRVPDHRPHRGRVWVLGHRGDGDANRPGALLDRKSTRLNSSHANISYAVFCLKKKNTTY